MRKTFQLQVEGKHPDNQLQMRLSAYVLAHRLGQVVEAANLRLSTMSDRRGGAGSRIQKLASKSSSVAFAARSAIASRR